MHRERVGTNCTRDSRDSGIDVHPTKIRHTRVTKKIRVAKQVEEETVRQIDIDLLLWGIAFLFTCWMFNLPVSLWTSCLVDQTFLALSAASFSVYGVLCIACGFKKSYPKHIQFLAWAFFFVGFALFCAGTWALFEWWSIYISIVTSAFIFSIAFWI